MVRTPRLAACWGKHAFSAAGADFTWLDVVLAAMAHAEWAPFERRLTEGLACAARAAAEGVEADAALVDAAALAFRYERDLIAGDEMNAWLARAGIGFDDWLSFLRREVLRKTWDAELDAIVDRYAPSARQLEAAAVIEGACSGAFDALAGSFARRVALAIAFDEPGPPDMVSPAPRVDAARLARQHAHWLHAHPPDVVQARLDVVLSIDERYRVVCERLTSPDALRAAIDAHRVDWTLLEADSIAFPTEHAAREAVLCIREDGLTMQDVGLLSRQAVQRLHIFVEDVPAAQRALWLSATEGQVLGPRGTDARFQVTRIRARIPPALDDPRVFDRARRRIIDDAATRAANEHVTARTSS